MCVADALIAAVAGLDLLTEISASSATVPEQARRPGVAERPFDVIVTLLCALGWTALPPGVAS
ncbi:MAG: hypothetical protein JW751_04790 [Polyangiaceae bacterium]|nr:hypothetical protein [Polyangiaceae bacterium]